MIFLKQIKSLIVMVLGVCNRANLLMRATIFYCLAIFSLSYPMSLLAANEINLSRSRLIQLALHLEVADAELKYEFSRVALIEMYKAYQYEFKKSLTNLPQDGKKRAKVRRWGYATQSFLESLDQYFFQLDSGKSLDFFVSEQNKVILFLAEQQPVIITGPNSGANKQMEHNIVEQFCQQYDCREYFQNTQVTSKKTVIEQTLVKSLPISADKITGSWSIKNTQQADFVTTNGIVFSFSNLQNRVFKERWALEIANELSRLEESLEKAQIKGHKINWSALKIDELPVTDKAYKITINAKGDYLKLPLPNLGAEPSLFLQLIPMMQAHLDNQQISHIIINKAEQFINQ